CHHYHEMINYVWCDYRRHRRFYLRMEPDQNEGIEDAVRNAISLGGDADTLAAIAGAIAEAIHSIPDTFKEQLETRYLADAPDMLAVIQKLYARSSVS
ncbi:hypothetical protein F4Y93_00155, partial [Candidatus Poribacteria bacterium]|nr:hypothetical protein [Candidatus Poribacteria bacterium]